MTAAIMFIFLGVPLLYCISAVPCVMLFIYLVVYASFFSKAIEVLTSKKPIKSWVAEVYLPYFFTRDPRKCSFKIVTDVNDEIFDVSNYQKKVDGF